MSVRFLVRSAPSRNGCGAQSPASPARGPAPATSHALGRPAAWTGPTAADAFRHRLGPLGHGLAPPAAHAAGRDIQRVRDRFIRPPCACRSRVALEQGAGALDWPHGRALVPAVPRGAAGQDLPFGNAQAPYGLQGHAILVGTRLDGEERQYNLIVAA